MAVVAGRRASVEGRRRQPRRFPRLVFAALGLSLAVVAGNSIVTSSVKEPDRAMTFADHVRPAVDRSTRQAAALEDLRSQAGSLGLEGLRRGVHRLVRESTAAGAAVTEVAANGSLRYAHGLLVTCLTTRSQALASLEAILAGRFEAGPPERAVDAMVEVGRDLAVSDRAYELFLEALPRTARSTMPASTWVVDETRYARPEMAALVSTLRAGASLAPVHDLTVVTVTIDPAPVGVDGPARVLPVSKTMKLQVVVANAGNVAERRVPVEAAVTSNGGTRTARRLVDLSPGQRVTVDLTVRPVPGGPLELKVRAGPAAEESSVGDNEQTALYVMR